MIEYNDHQTIKAVSMSGSQFRRIAPDTETCMAGSLLGSGGALSLSIYIYMCIYIYIYIYRERERYTHVCIYIYIYIYTHTHFYACIHVYIP